MISRSFDVGEQEKAQDDDGKFLKDEGGTFGSLEVAHIVPHSLITVGSGTLQ